MSEWKRVEDEAPNKGQKIIAVGTWCGATRGLSDGQYMGIGVWKENHVLIDCDAFSTWIINVTHWKELPEYP